MNANVMLRQVVLDRLEYNPLTGSFTWVRDQGRIKAGTHAGRWCDKHNGGAYLRIKLNGTEYYAHRLAFLIMEGWIPQSVDHRSLNTRDNSWSNLRAATIAQQNRNRSMHKRNKLGAKGVTLVNGKYQARIGVNGKKINLGKYDSLDEAKEAYAAGSRKHHGDFGRACPESCLNSKGELE